MTDSKACDTNYPTYPPNGLGDYLTKSGIGICKTSYGHEEGKIATDVSLGSVGFFAGPRVKAEAGFIKTRGTTEGCEQVIAQANQYNNTILNVKCTLSKHVTSATNRIAVVNKINAEGAKLECKNINFLQTINIKSLAATSFSDQSLNDITDNIINGLDETAQLMQNSESGFGATPQGSKFLKESKTNLFTDNSKKDIKETITTTLNSIFANNELNIKNINFSAENCNFTQDVIIEVVATTLVDTVFSNFFSSYIEAQKKSLDKIEQVSKNAGAPTLGPFLQFGENSTNNIVMLIGGIICLCLLSIFASCAFSFISNNMQDETDNS
jgi:hypothetical protein